MTQASTKSTSDEEKAAGARYGLDHAWRHFALHAGQRLTVFNFYTAISGLLTAGVATVLQGSPRFAIVGVALGLLISLTSFIFWKLDQRAVWLVKYAENLMSHLEPDAAGAAGCVFSNQDASFESEQGRIGTFSRPWTYGQSFRTLFTVMAIIGLAAATLSGARAAGWLSWGDKATQPICASATIVLAPAPGDRNPQTAIIATPSKPPSPGKPPVSSKPTAPGQPGTAVAGPGH